MTHQIGHVTKSTCGCSIELPRSVLEKRNEGLEGKQKTARKKQINWEKKCSTLWVAWDSTL